MKILILFGALGINLSMFLLMDNMISQDRVRVVDLVETQAIEFVRSPMEEELRTKDRRSTPPPKPQEIQRPQAEVTDIAQRASSFPAQAAAFNVTSLLGEGGAAGVAIGQTLVGAGGNDLGVMMADDLVPLSMLPPQYPPAARARGTEGWVDLLFTVTDRGIVSDAQVIESEPAEIFDRAAIDAALRWRFRPVVENGEPLTVFRQVRINFTLEMAEPR
ncbi:MAG: energy transducer TonB [Pseudomonadales bacterium]|nr:energy transducer TonB [Pseudomonadales bacterium]